MMLIGSAIGTLTAVPVVLSTRLHLDHFVAEAADAVGVINRSSAVAHIDTQTVGKGLGDTCT